MTRAEEALYCVFCDELAVDFIDGWVADVQHVGLPLCRKHFGVVKREADRQDRNILIAAIGK